MYMPWPARKCWREWRACEDGVKGVREVGGVDERDWQVKTRLKHLFSAMEAWKRGDAEDASQAASRSEFPHPGSSAAHKGGAESGKAAGIKRSDSEDSSVRPSVPANNTAKRPLKKVASGSSE